MKQEVFVIGRDLKDLVPFSVTFNHQYAVTLVETQDVVNRAAAIARQQHAWFLLILPSEDDEEAWQALERIGCATSVVIEDGEDPVIALAHLIAAASWEEAERAEAPVASPLEARQHHG